MVKCGGKRKMGMWVVMKMRVVKSFFFFYYTFPLSNRRFFFLLLLLLLEFIKYFFWFVQVVDHHTGEELDQRWIIGGCLVPLILLSWVPNLKKLAPVSMVANIFMGVGLGITFYYLVWDLPPISEVPQVGSIDNFPVFFSLTIFAMEAIGVVRFFFFFNLIN